MMKAMTKRSAIDQLEELDLIVSTIARETCQRINGIDQDKFKSIKHARQLIVKRLARKLENMA